MTSIRLLDRDDLLDIQSEASATASMLGLPSTAPDIELLKALEQHLATLVDNQSADEIEIEQVAFESGCLWGECLVRTLGWHWIGVRFSSQLGSHSSEVVGVAPSDHSLVIYPFQTVFLVCEKVLPVRIVRSLEVLTEPGRVPMLPPGGLENVMDHIE